MKKTLLALFIIFTVSLPALSIGAEITMLKNDVTKNGNIAWSNCTYLNKGPVKPYDKKFSINDYIQENYRVGFVVNEIYYSITIEKIKAPTEDGDMPIIVDSFNIDGMELAQTVKLKEKGEVITDIKFIKWNNWNSFTLEIHKKKIKFKILENNKVELIF